MSSLHLSQHPTEQWHKLVKEAEQFYGMQLDEELESYLVFLLMRYTEKPELAAKVMALDYLEGSQSLGQDRCERMRDVGDQCLLFSGLFPRRAERRRVKISYYVDLGRSAYQNVAEATQTTIADMYSQLAKSFVDLMDVLQAMRCVNYSEGTQLQPIQAFELWQDTSSQMSEKILAKSTQTPLVRPPAQAKKKH